MVSFKNSRRCLTSWKENQNLQFIQSSSFFSDMWTLTRHIIDYRIGQIPPHEMEGCLWRPTGEYSAPASKRYFQPQPPFFLATPWRGKNWVEGLAGRWIYLAKICNSFTNRKSEGTTTRRREKTSTQGPQRWKHGKKWKGTSSDSWFYLSRMDIESMKENRRTGNL